jgi:hypothetical protein
MWWVRITVGEARIFEAASALRPADGELKVDGIQLRELLAEEATADLVWDVSAGTFPRTYLFTLDIQLYVLCEPGPLTSEVAVSRVQVAGGFAPIPSPNLGGFLKSMTADSSLGIPRFAYSLHMVPLSPLKPWTA